jgi:hypothetical protein
MKPFAGFFERAYSFHFAGAASGGAAALSSNLKRALQMPRFVN